mgnify:CR=1 FL=1
MKEQLKKGFFWLRPAIIRLIVAIVCGWTMAVYTEAKYTIIGGWDNRRSTETLTWIALFVTGILTLAILYVFIVWLYSDTKKETT